MKQARARLQTLGESVLVGLAETQFGSPLCKTGRVDLAGVQALTDMRFTFLAVAPIRDSAAEALGSYIAAHNSPKPDIGVARSVALDPGAKTVYSNGFQVKSVIPGGERLKLSGTSMAAPNVTNVAAKQIALDRR
jgi:hypothetical protein